MQTIPAPQNGLEEDADWVHASGRERPEQYKCGPIIGNRTEVGACLHPKPNPKEVDERTAQRRAKIEGEKEDSPIWARDAGGRQIEVWFKDPSRHARAARRLTEMRGHEGMALG
jgi:hypothetical protein